MTSYVNADLFNFIKHWDEEDKKYIASCCYNIYKLYPNGDSRDYIQITIEMLLRYYRKHGQNLLANKILAGCIKKEISLKHHDNYYHDKVKVDDKISNRKIFVQHIALDLNLQNYDSELQDDLFLRDLRKILNNNYQIVQKILLGESLTASERGKIFRSKGKLREYFNI